MKNVTFMGLLLGVVFVGVGIYASTPAMVGDSIGGKKIMYSPKIIPNGESKSKAFRNLSKKFEFHDSKPLSQKSFLKQNKNNNRLSMQKFNRYQYRRSHSVRPNIPTIKPGAGNRK
jgi:hypothetical protein